MSWAQAVGASERVFELLDRQPLMTPAGSRRPTGAAEGGKVELRDVWCVPDPDIDVLLTKERD